MAEKESSTFKESATILFSLITILVIFIVILNHYKGYGFIDLPSFTGSLYSMTPKIFVILVLFLAFKIVLFLINRFLLKFEGIIVDKKRSTNVRKLIKFVWWFIYVITISSILFGNVGAIITSLGLVGFGITFALQKPILNYTGWLTIVLKNIYNEGDRIRIGDVRGDVKEVQVMNTVLYSLLENSDIRSHKIVTVPNELVLTSNVENYTRESNYVLEELNISITYESNYQKAMKLLNDIVKSQIKKNIKSYIKEKKKQGHTLEDLISNLKGKKTKKKEEKPLNVPTDQNVKEVKELQEEINKEIQQVEEIEEEFKPRVRLELADSSIVLVAQFLTPYNEIKQNRTDINTAFLDAISKEKDIEIAYPHMELVYHPKEVEKKVI